MNVRTGPKVDLDVEYPMVLALCDGDDDGAERVVGWLFVLDGDVVSYLPDMNGRGHAVGVFSSVASAARVLGCAGLWVTPTSDSDLPAFE